MIFVNHEKVYYNSFNFLMTDYGYYIDSKDTEKGLWYSKFILLNEKYPKITVIIDRSYLDVQLEIENTESWPLGLLYRFLHHDKVIRSKFNSVKIINEYFEKKIREYLDDILKNLNSLTNAALHNFYKEFPFCLSGIFW